MSVSSEINFTQVNPSTLVQCLETCIDASEPAFTWGPPGIGKSRIVDQTGTRLLRPVLDLRVSQWDAVDSRGVPHVFETKDGMRTGWAIPSVFPTDPLSNVLIHFDELNTAPLSVQAALLQLFLERRLGDYVLPPNVRMLASGNRETDRASANRMSSALADRFFHFELLVDHSEWELWALDHGVHVAVISYIRWRKEHLHSWDAKSASKAQATPRGWEKVSNVLKVIETKGVNGAAESALVCGKVGDAIGTEFVGFLRIFRKLPDPDGVILAPDASPISDDPAVSYALCGALAARTSELNVDRVLKYAQRLNDSPAAGPEFMTYLVNSARIKHPEIQQTRGFIAWAAKNPDVFI